MHICPPEFTARIVTSRLHVLAWDENTKKTRFNYCSFAGKTTFSKIVALNAFEGHIRYEGDKTYLNGICHFWGANDKK